MAFVGFLLGALIVYLFTMNKSSDEPYVISKMSDRSKQTQDKFNPLFFSKSKPNFLKNWVAGTTKDNIVITCDWQSNGDFNANSSLYGAGLGNSKTSYQDGKVTWTTDQCPPVSGKGVMCKPYFTPDYPGICVQFTGSRNSNEAVKSQQAYFIK